MTLACGGRVAGTSRRGHSAKACGFRRSGRGQSRGVALWRACRGGTGGSKAAR